MDTPPRKDRSGRPRDPDVDRRITAAALQVFGRLGWSGFSMEAVARAAGVGKASLYLRWSSKEELLTEAVASRFAPIAEIDNGDVHTDLLEFADLLMELFHGPDGLAARRMAVESRLTPGIAERWQRVRESQIRASRAIVKRAVARGELSPHTPVSLLLDALHGAVVNHSLAAPEHIRQQAAARRRYARRLVDFLLASLRAHTAERPGRALEADVDSVTIR
ncbi:TetR/AcrR family transcriptional regulator [Thermobifida halotolerans]|uniref:TetR/AcrR family transcriptional regulator n=1 Tax=Thermobifida halotolerans TaxID=483545 RepID=A0AA97LZH5_9ACTN|nr:TetR/AcrR family transcriptional regulator [Thermobifida halotolerans]UOE20683.1 TetR/AcrR family transcriptional regulator [Thermobifida halotolerans]